MERWIKPSELPEGFFNKCWVVYRDDDAIIQEPIYVTASSGKSYWVENLDKWQFMDGQSYRLYLGKLPLKWEGAFNDQDLGYES